MTLRRTRSPAHRRVARILLLSLSMLLALAPLMAQTVSPTSVGPICTGFPVSITLPPAALTDQVDVFFLFDDTSSFEGVAPSVIGIFTGLVNSLETALPGVSFAFGVGRFEDYGGPGNGFSFPQASDGRPFILNQPIVTSETAGGAGVRDTLIKTALAQTAPGLGGDPPEAAIEGLNQVATGSGFDGDGNGSTLGSGAAGDPATQIAPGTTGDVPAFSSNTLPASGTLGGAGWRPGALHLIILATDICPVAAFPSGSPIPASITGAGGSSEPSAAFACSATKPGSNRFGFVSDSKTVEGNTIVDADNNRTAIAPLGAATVQGTVSALNALGIRVLGMGPGVAPTPFLGPSFDPSTWLSAMARLTGAVDGFGSPLVFDTDVSLNDLSAAILSGITTTTTLPVDISLSTSSLPPGLSFSFAPPVRKGVSPGGKAQFDVTLDAGGSAVDGTFHLNFIDVASKLVLGTIPVAVSCSAAPTIDLSVTKTVDNPTPNVGGNVVFTVAVSNAAALSTATGVTVRDALPAGLTYVSSSASQGSYDGTSIWTVGTLASPATATLTITAKVTTVAAKTNLAQVQAADQADRDSTPGNAPGTHEDDDASVTVTPTLVDLSVTKTVDNATPNVGSNVVFTVTVSNAAGLSTATGVAVKDVLPEGLTYVSSTASQGSYNGTSTWTVGTLASPATATLTITATVTKAGATTNLAQVQTADQADLDSTPGNAPATHEDDDASVIVTPSLPPPPPGDHSHGKGKRGHDEGDGRLPDHHGHFAGDDCHGSGKFHHEGDGCLPGHHGHFAGDNCHGSGKFHHEGDGCVSGHHGHFAGDDCRGRDGFHHDADGHDGRDSRHVGFAKGR